MKTIQTSFIFKLSLVLFTFFTLNARASVTLLDKDQWKILMGGFVETDTIVDSSRGYAEVAGNSPVGRVDSVGRTQFSIRNSRLSFTVEAPEQEGWKSKAYYELDFLGYDVDPSKLNSNNTEAGLFNNPTLRTRHLYLQADKEGWSILAGQTWMLLGWQPYYFMPTLQVSPISGMLYGRTAQIHILKTQTLADQTTWQAALGIMRPPQRDANLPGFEGGLRWAAGTRSSGFAGGGSAPVKTQPLSVGLSGAYREIATPSNTSDATSSTTHHSGYAAALDTLIPVIASSDGKDVSNTLSFGGEFTIGKGYGDQFANWTGNLVSPLNTAAAAPTKNTNLDAGIGGYDSSGAFQLVKLRTFNGYLQYHLPAETRTWLGTGYGQLYSSNIGQLTGSSTTYDKQETYFGNILHDCTNQIRVGLEYAYSQTHYSDNLVTHNNRVQVSAWFIF